MPIDNVKEAIGIFSGYRFSSVVSYERSPLAIPYQQEALMPYSQHQLIYLRKAIA
ncbi:hypothetical protein QT971_12610 [Microcoleus sp. herbarium19]|uniref:hypothetical protein n=1 Tax=unclassified Microcoleus TaxID=2642155 RepID=UPI002FD02623